MKGKEEHAAITVWLSLLSVLFLSLICTSVESARIAGARAQTANAVEAGNYSVFGEYEKMLLEKYEIFAVDGAYGTGNFSIGRVRDKWKGYIAKNTEAPEGIAGVLSFDPWQISVSGCAIEEYALLTDTSGEAFYQQAVGFMKKTAVAGMTGKFLEYYRDARTLENSKDEFEQKQKQSDEEMKSLEQKEQEIKKEQEEAQDGAIVPVEPQQRPENPLKALNRLRRKSLLEIVCRGDISGKKVSGREICSARRKRYGNMKIDKQYGGIGSDLLFAEYLLDHFYCYTDKEKAGKLNYQIEYLIGGKKTDEKNLKSTVQQLLVFREGMNYLYCIENAELNGAASGLAALLIGWTGIPVLTVILKHALMLGIAYAESLLDVRTLLDGGKIPIAKTPETWMLNFDNLALIEDLLAQDGKKRQEGFSYREYLRLLLYLQPMSKKKMRGLDLIEMDLSEQSGLSNFHADYCVVGIKGETDWTIPSLFSGVSGAYLGIGGQSIKAAVKSGFQYG